MLKDKDKSKGFTLIELLVIIAIIGLLTAVVLVALGAAKMKARDARRLSEVNQLIKALTLYSDSNTQVYPASGGAASPSNSWSNSNDSSWTTLQGFLSNYLSKMPVDPLQSPSGWAGTPNTYSYAYFSDPTGTYGCAKEFFIIVYQLEIASGPDPGVRACDGTFFQYGGAGASTTIKTIGVTK